MSSNINCKEKHGSSSDLRFPPTQSADFPGNPYNATQRNSSSPTPYLPRFDVAWAERHCRCPGVRLLPYLNMYVT